MASCRYCIDASSLLKLKEDYPRKVFRKLWENVEQLIADERLVAPEEVYREIEFDDELSPWAQQHKRMFKKIDAEIWKLSQ